MNRNALRAILSPFLIPDRSGGCAIEAAFVRSIARLFCLVFLAIHAHAQNPSFRDLTFQGDLAAKNGNIAAAFKCYSAAEPLAHGNATNLCALTKNFCDLMYSTPSPSLQRTLVQQALTCSQAAVKADPGNATAHICAAICYAKNFPYADNQTKVYYSRSIKSESEAAISLDPRQDIAYYLLGRWNYGVANMNFFYRGLVRIIYGGLPAASNAEAVKDLEHAIALNPIRIIHHAELAKVYAAIGEKKLAHQELAKCAALKPLDRDDAEARAEANRELSAPAECSR